MNNCFNVVMFWFHDDWGRYGRAYERVAEHLSELPEIGRVVCVFPPVLTSKGRPRSRLVIRQGSRKVTLLSETDAVNVRHDRPLLAIRRWFDFVRQRRALNDYFRKRGFRADNTILWVFPPHPYIDRLREVIPHRGVITHVIDDFTKFNPEHPLYAFAKAQYPRLAQWSDMIVTTSKANQEFFSRAGRPCHMFWPAVDDSFLAAPGELPYRAGGGRPRLGYVGWIMERTDLELIKYVATHRPDWQVTLVGPQYPEDILERSGVLTQPNVEYRGPILQDEVPAFLQSLDVCLMPHADTEYSRSMGPLKLYQYLASGRPIVSTSVEGLDQLREYIHVAGNYEEFVHHIEDALGSDNTELSRKRIEAARTHTWSLRVRQIFDVVTSELKLDMGNRATASV